MTSVAVTFDVSVVRIEQGVVEVISSHGNNHLGGDDFDQKIVAHVLEHLKIKADIEVVDNPRAMARILRAAEAAKRHLSDHPYARIEEEYLAERDGQPVHLSLELARDEYEQMITSYVEETLQAIHIALKGADLTASQVGGNPAGRRRHAHANDRPAAARSIRLKPRGEVDADLCVAMGAAIEGASIGGTEVSAVLVDVTPYTFGTSALGELEGELYPYQFVPIIPRNTPIPVRKSEAFYTILDNQPAVDVRIFQGEDPDALSNIEIGQFLVEGLSRAPAGNPVVIDLALDRDGILHVAAREKTPGSSDASVSSRRSPTPGGGGVGGGTGTDRRAVRGWFDCKIDAGAGFDDTGLAALLERARDKLDTAGEEDRNEIVDLMETIRDAQVANDISGLEKVRTQLADLMFYLET